MWFDIIWLVCATLVAWFSFGYFIAVVLNLSSKKLYSDLVGDKTKLRHLVVSGIIVLAMIASIVKTYPF